MDRYVQAWYEYGVRKGPALGILFHMAEGGGTVGYLDNKGVPPKRGVSVHAVIEYDGSIVQMLNYAHASGSLNPADRSTNKAYYGHDVLVSVLGKWWTDPNSAVISCEIEGFAKDGPNSKQVISLVRWSEMLQAKFPTLVGAIGHADQTDTKGCPGTTAAMKSVFDSVGGHGKWSTNTDMSYSVPKVPSIGDVVKDGILYTTNPPNASDPNRV